MRQVITALVAMTCLLFFKPDAVRAQVPKTASVGFNNRSEMNVIVIGYTVVNGSKKAGPALQLKKGGGKAFENSVPTGAVRYFTIHDANQLGNILCKQQITITGDVNFDIVPNSNNPKMLMIVAAAKSP
jgi:hypothetical protein